MEKQPEAGAAVTGRSTRSRLMPWAGTAAILLAMILPVAIPALAPLVPVFGVALVAGGIIGFIRGQGFPAKAVSVAAVVVGVLLLIVTVLFVLVDRGGFV